ncbi:MAG: hypothetical protein ACT4OX_11055 [Actinomycetota bacterium]
MFAVADMATSLAHYATLGFDMESHDEKYVFAERDGIVLDLVRGRESIVSSPSAVYLHVSDVDMLASEWRSAPAENMDYGLRESRHLDPDGNVIRFGSPPG